MPNYLLPTIFQTKSTTISTVSILLQNFMKKNLRQVSTTPTQDQWPYFLIGFSSLKIRRTLTDRSQKILLSSGHLLMGMNDHEWEQAPSVNVCSCQQLKRAQKIDQFSIVLAKMWMSANTCCQRRLPPFVKRFMCITTEYRRHHRHQSITFTFWSAIL